MSTTTTTGMSEELELLERVLLRLGCADTDEQLQTSVSKFLAPVLLKITSPNETVRLKVMEVLTHINKRLKSRPLVQIPIEPILTQYQSTESSFAINFSIIYITMGFPRLDTAKQTELAPIMLNCLEGKPEIHQDKLLMLVLPLLSSIKFPEDVENRKTLLGLSDKPATKKKFISLLEDVLLLPYGITQDAEIPPGMSNYSFKRVVANNWKAEDLENLKKGIVRFLCAGVFSEIDILAPLVIASADTRFSVATPALVEVNKFSGSLDWTVAHTSEALYVLFCGNGSKIPDRKTSPCSARVRQKLLQYLLKCHGNGINTAKGIQVIFEALFGENTNRKCKVLALQFADNLIKESPRELINKLSKVFLNGFSKLIGPTQTEDIDVQTAAYSAIAQLAQVCPNLFNRDLQLVITYFKHLIESPTELNTPIREALIAIAPAFSWKYKEDVEENKMDVDEVIVIDDGSKFKPNSNQSLLLAHLAEHAESTSAIVQNVTCTFLTTCFPETFVPSRYLLLLVAGQTPQLRESVLTHLYGTSKKDNIQWSYLSSVNKNTENDNNIDGNLIQLRKVVPDFKILINHIHEMSTKRLLNPQLTFMHGKNLLPYKIETYIEILDYLRICLWYTAGAQCEPGDEKSMYLLFDYLSNQFKQSDEPNEINKYLELVKQLVKSRCGYIELSCLLDLLNIAPKIFSEKNLDLLEKLTESLKEISEDVRNLVGKLWGILVAYGNTDDGFNREISEMLTKMTQKSLENRHGSYIALANAFYWKLRIMKEAGDVRLNELEKWKEFKQLMEGLVSILYANQPLLKSAAVKGISIIGSIVPLPFENGDSSTIEAPVHEKMEVDDESSGSIVITKTSIMDTIKRILSNASMRNKIREDAAHCLGHLSVGDRDFFSKKILKLFLNLLKMTKDPAIHIAMGQALVYTIQGNINESYTKMKSSDGSEMINCDDETFEEFLKDLIKNVTVPQMYSRQACAIWLLALVKNCSKRNTILNNRSLLQMAFTDLLSEDSELVQDVSSRGLGLIFGLSSSEDQENLATSLLETLTGGRKHVKKVADDTKIFEEGALGRTPTGGNITTYKELCSLASDLNQPDLIYQFMQLANHNSIWTSKLGAAFGLQSISKKAKVQIEPYLKKIVPRLYRYKYDPTPKIQNSMCSIWDSIIIDSNATIEMYYWEILEEATTHLTSTEWRVRIACCLAVRDLIKRPSGLKLRSDIAKNLHKMETDEIPEPELFKLWQQLFRVMDDIHEGTRIAAEGTTKVLSKVCIVAASTDHGKSGSNVASTVLPFLLETGVTNTVAEIRQISIQTISELIESCGDMISPHLTLLVPCLLRATGELEMQKLSYLSARHSGQSETQEAIDSVRAEAAKSHYCTETLSKCLKYINYPELEKMTPGVLDVMKTSISLGSKVACAHFLCSISIRLGKEMTPLVAKYVNHCFVGLSDRNATVRKYYASAIGHLLGYAKENTVLKTFAKLTDLYFEQQSNRAIPQVVHSINKRHGDLLKDYSPQVLPLLFFAMHEEINEDNDNKPVIELWKELWIDISPGDAGIRMNLDAIIPLIEKSIDNSSWLLKAQSASSINAIATRLGTNLDSTNRIRLINLILKYISGRTFKGKERMLEAISSLNKHLSNDESDLKIKIIEAVMREARKEEPVYRTHALKALGNVLDDSEIDRFEEVYNMVWYLLDKQELSTNTEDDGSKIVTSDEKKKSATIFVALKEAVCLALGKAWPINSFETQEKYQTLFVEKCLTCLQNNTRPVQLSLLVALGKFVERLKIFETAQDEEGSKEKKLKFDENKIMELEKICKSILSIVVSVADIPHTGLKKESLDVILVLIKRLKENNHKKILIEVKTTFNDILIVLQKDNSPEVRCRLKDIETKLNE